MYLYWPSWTRTEFTYDRWVVGGGVGSKVVGGSVGAAVVEADMVGSSTVVVGSEVGSLVGGSVAGARGHSSGPDTAVCLTLSKAIP